MSVNTEINRITNEVATQKSLIEQITTALDGKAAGGGGASIDTCTVVINNEVATLGNRIYAYGMTVYDNDNITVENVYDVSIAEETLTINNVICGSFIYITQSGYSFTGIRVEGGIEQLGWASTGQYKAPTTAGATGIITLYDND